MTMYEKIARMKPEQTNHWIEIPELSYWGERFFAEFSVAEVLAEPEEKALLEQIELSKKAGLSHVKPHKDHMFSNVGLVVLANTISPEAQKLIKKTRFRKNYRLTFYGWTEYQLAAYELSTNCFFSNPAGSEARKNLERNFAPKKAGK